jgi:hypothetical protein
MSGSASKWKVGVLADDDQIATFSFALDGSRRRVLDFHGGEEDAGSAARFGERAKERLDLVPKLIEDHLVAVHLVGAAADGNGLRCGRPRPVDDAYPCDGRAPLLGDGDRPILGDAAGWGLVDGDQNPSEHGTIP